MDDEKIIIWAIFLFNIFLQLSKIRYKLAFFWNISLFLPEKYFDFLLTLIILLFVRSFWYLQFFVLVVFLLFWMVLLSFVESHFLPPQVSALLLLWFLPYFQCRFYGNLNDSFSAVSTFVLSNNANIFDSA